MIRMTKLTIPLMLASSVSIVLARVLRENQTTNPGKYVQANMFRLIGFLTVQSWLHCFSTICFTFLENQDNNFHIMLMWILTEKNIYRQTYWVFNMWFCFPYFISFPLKQENISHKAEKLFDIAVHIYIFFFITISLQNNYRATSTQTLGNVMMSKTKPTRARCHGDYTWNTPQTFWSMLLSL